jgi:hypothetical protein
VTRARFPRSDNFKRAAGGLSSADAMAGFEWARRLARLDESPPALAEYVGDRLDKASRYELDGGLWIEARIRLAADGHLETCELIDMGVNP